MDSRKKFQIKIIFAHVELIILSIFYYTIWHKFNFDVAGPGFEGNAKYILSAIYLLLIAVVFSLCDSFELGNMKLSDLQVSQWISMFMVNVIAYLQICLVAGRMVEVQPLFITMAADIVVCFAFGSLFDYIYHRMSPPEKLLIIYGAEEDGESIKNKFMRRSDTFDVSDILCASVGIDLIKKEIDQHQGIILSDFSGVVRISILNYAYATGKSIYVVPRITDVILKGSSEINIFDTPLNRVNVAGLTRVQNFNKRCLDICLCLIALVITSPIMLIVSLLIKLEDGGPVFFKQKRVTRGGREFDILKFRSMVIDAEKGGYNLSMRAGESDPRITKIGRFIRSCRIDELPQILNIIKGDMSIVGPRPERIENVIAYSEEIPEFIYRNRVLGGLTGYAQIYGKYNTSALDKLKLDLKYIENYSFLLDIKLIFMTVQILFRNESTEGFEKKE